MSKHTIPVLNAISKEHINDVYNYLKDMNTSDSGFDFRALKLRPVFRDRLFPLVFTIFFYSLLVLVGLFGNGTVFYVIWKRGSHRKFNTLACVLNMTFAFLIQLTLVIPLTLFVIVVDNWVMGSVLCYLLPMIQDIPGYCLMMTMALISFDRRRFLFNPRKGNISVRWAIGLTWAISIVLVLPYIGYIVFIDLSVLGSEFVGGQICIISLSGKASTYIKSLFVFFYALPMLASISFLRRTSKIIRKRESEQTGYRSGEFTDNEYVEYSRYSTPRYWNNEYLSEDYRQSSSNYYRQQPHLRRENKASLDSLYQIDVQKEKRSQKFLYLIITTYFVCLFPLNILKLVRQLIMETYDNTGDFDVTYIVIVWVAFLPTVFVPWYFAQWIFLGDDISKDNLRFYLSNKTDSGVNFPGVSDPIWENVCCPLPPQRTPTPPPPPGYSYPKKSKKKSKASGSSSSSSIGYHRSSKRHMPHGNKSINNGNRNNVGCQCTCGVENRRVQKYSASATNTTNGYHHQRKKSRSQSFGNGSADPHHSSNRHLNLLNEGEYQTLTVTPQFDKRPSGNWSLSMHGLSATQV